MPVQTQHLIEEVRAFRALHPDITYVDLIIMDLAGTLIGKRYPIAMLEHFAAGSMHKFARAALLLGSLGTPLHIDDYAYGDGDPDRQFHLVPGSLVRVGWEREPIAQMLVTSASTAEPVVFEPRVVLEQVVQRLHSKGIHPTVAFELEFYLLDLARAEGRVQPARDPLTGARDGTAYMGLSRLTGFGSILHEMVRCANEQGIDTTVIQSEMGPGQYEINFAHSSDPLRAADESALFCRVAKGVAVQQGCAASFMAKPYLDHAGSGMHLHVSLYDAAGQNLLGQGDNLRHAVAGCLAWAPWTMPIFSPNYNAFRRYAGTINAPSRASWGVENRNASIRIPACEAIDLRIEHRLGGANANPYLALAAVLSAMEYGLEQGLQPIAPVTEDANSGIAFPADMPAAVQAMQQASALLGNYLDPEFLNIYCQNRLQDYHHFLAEISPREYTWFA